MNRLRPIFVALTIVCVISVVLLVLFNQSATTPVNAQAPTQLAPLVTDQTPMALSNQFGAPQQSVINQNGEYAFLGTSASAMFVRRSGMGIQRIFQMNDEVPGFPGSLADISQSIRINNSGVVVFHIDFSKADGKFQGAILKFDGTSLTPVVTGADTAPGSGGALYERNISLSGFNDAGDVAFTAPLTTNQQALFIIPGGGSAVRVAGVGDAAPGTAGTFSSFTPVSLNNVGEVLFRANIVG